SRNAIELQGSKRPWIKPDLNQPRSVVQDIPEVAVEDIVEHRKLLFRARDAFGSYPIAIHVQHILLAEEHSEELVDPDVAALAGDALDFGLSGPEPEVLLEVMGEGVNVHA